MIGRVDERVSEWHFFTQRACEHPHCSNFGQILRDHYDLRGICDNLEATNLIHKLLRVPELDAALLHDFTQIEPLSRLDQQEGVYKVNMLNISIPEGLQHLEAKRLEGKISNTEFFVGVSSYELAAPRCHSVWLNTKGVLFGLVGVQVPPENVAIGKGSEQVLPIGSEMAGAVGTG